MGAIAVSVGANLSVGAIAVSVGANLSVGLSGRMPSRAGSAFHMATAKPPYNFDNLIVKFGLLLWPVNASKCDRPCQAKNMSQTIETEIKACEEELKEAMLKSDTELLDRLLSPDLIFTNHLGQLMTKEDDLNAHRSGLVKIDRIELGDLQIKSMGSIAVVTVQARIQGSYRGESSENEFRFTRVWSKNANNNWQIAVAHSTLVA